MPSRGSKLLNLLDAGLSELRGRRLYYEEIGDIAGQCASTILDWANGANLRQIESFIRIFERLPRVKRAEILERICRQMPSIHAEAISWSGRNVTNCEDLLRKERGCSVIQGEQNARDYLFTALAHSGSQIKSPISSVCGLDSRSADHFVPADGINYLRASLDMAKLRELAQLAWPAILKSKAPLVMLNGIWAALPELHGEIFEMATSRHVFIAENLGLTEARLAEQLPIPGHVLSVKRDADRRISINVQAIC
jgi:hypothetical protein